MRHARGDMGTPLAFARCPSPFATTWRVRCGSRPGSAHRVPKTPRRPPVVANRATCGNRITCPRSPHSWTAPTPTAKLAGNDGTARVVSTFYVMPNQLSKSKRRQSLAEHEAVLAALAEIARREDTTVMALLREAARDVVRKRSAIPSLANAIRTLVWQMAPRMPARFKTPAQMARFKRAQREFDQVVLDLNLETPAAIQKRNSLVPPHLTVRMVDFDRAHASKPTAQ